MSQRKLIANDLDLEIYFPEANAVLPDRPVPVLPASWTNLVSAFAAQAKATPNALLVTDRQGMRLTYQQAFLGAIAFAQVINRHAGDSDYVGIMLPPSAGGFLANLAVPMTGRGVVNLNYMLSQDVANGAIRQTGLKTIVTSRAVLEKTGFKFDVNVIFAEDIKGMVGKVEGARAWLASNFAPNFLLPLLGVPGYSQSLDDIATVMFTTGSTGDPKGVELTHSNILYNIVQVLEHTGISRKEVFLGILPYFHSYGYMATLWAVACLGMSVVCHHNGLEVKDVGEQMEKEGVTVMAGTPTVIRQYLRRCTREQFAKVHLLLLGSEKMLPSLAADIEEKLGVCPVEGMGATECSPVISGGVNKDVLTPSGKTVWGNRPGSVGQAVPGTALCILDLDTGAIMPRGKENVGLLLVGGPQNMRGYLNKPQETAGVLQNGWYFTGDLASVDEDGFLYIIDRASEIAKIGAEKVPMLLVKLAIVAVMGLDETTVHVKKAPDAAKGEKLVVLYTGDLDARVVVDRLGKLEEPEMAEALKKLDGKALHEPVDPPCQGLLQGRSLPAGTVRQDRHQGPQEAGARARRRQGQEVGRVTQQRFPVCGTTGIACRSAWHCQKSRRS
jgi:Acyl-CoA synthetases (AMP-forming)/AMP-acid ligases II